VLLLLQHVTAHGFSKAISSNIDCMKKQNLLKVGNGASPYNGTICALFYNCMIFHFAFFTHAEVERSDTVIVTLIRLVAVFRFKICEREIQR
jgi:hypothetical protein